jgi:hypothetical protein
MKLWIAREKCGALFIYNTKPYKSHESHIFKVDDGIFMGVLNSEEFLNVTFENSPMEVELKLIEK